MCRLVINRGICVRHRIDGLEKVRDSNGRAYNVRHRIDGLEIVLLKRV